MPAQRTVLVSSAASPAVAQLLAEGAANLAGSRPGAAGAGAELSVRDVVPIAEADPRGAAINLAFLPLIVVCLPLVALLGRLELSPARLLAALAAFAALSGLLVVALIGAALGALPGSYLALSAVAALIVLAVALPTAGFMRVLGPPGIGLGALLFLVIGNPGSGNATAPELLPGFWRVTGQLLPPGSGGQALRNVAYFDGHALAQPLLVLGAWALLGGVLVLAARRRTPAAQVPERSEPRVAVAKLMGRLCAAAGSSLFFALAPGVVAGLVPWWLTGWRTGGASLPARVLGTALLVGGAAVLVHAFARFVIEGIGTPAPVAPTEHLVVGGFYRYVRNPMYLAVEAAIAGQALLLGRPVLLAYAAAVAPVVYAFVRCYEEPALTRRFGAAYERYRREVPGWWPRAPGRR